MGGILLSQDRERFFEDADLDHKEVRLALFSPTVSRIEPIAELRKKGLISIEQLIVIGVYHEKETLEYQKSKEYVSLSFFLLSPKSI